MRVSHGREINAACGQLANTYNKFKKKLIKKCQTHRRRADNALGQKTYVLSAFLFNIAQKPLFPIIEWIAGSVLKSPFFKDTAVSGRYRRVHFYLL